MKADDAPLGIEEVMILFHGAVAAVENGQVAEIDIAIDDEEAGLSIVATIRRKQWEARAEDEEDGNG